MHILEHNIILISFFIIAFIILVCSINISICVKYKRNISIIFIHILSLFMILALFCLLMDTVILGLSFENTYKQLLKLSIYFFLLTLIFYMIIFLVIMRKKHYYGLVIPNYKNVYSHSRDLALVVDYRGIVVHSNHPEILNNLCQNNNKLIDILRELDGKILCRNFLIKDISEIRETLESEIYMADKDIYYLMKISPIVSTGEILGYIVLFQDVSVIRRSEIELKSQNKCLETTNEKLVQYMKINASLESEKKRLQILEHVQKSIIEKIEIVASQITKINSKNYNDLSYKVEIKQVAKNLRLVYKDVRISVNSIAGEESK